MLFTDILYFNLNPTYTHTHTRIYFIFILISYSEQVIAEETRVGSQEF